MPSVDDLIRLIQEAQAGKDDVVQKSQAVDAASAAAAAAAQAVNEAVTLRDSSVAAQAAKVDEVLAMVHTLFGPVTAASS